LAGDDERAGELSLLNYILLFVQPRAKIIFQIPGFSLVIVFGLLT
jgi:hypothetical protein